MTSYKVEATKAAHTFDYPTGGQTVGYIAEDGMHDFGDIHANTRALLAATAGWNNTDSVTVTWSTSLSTADADSVQFDVSVFSTDAGGTRTEVGGATGVTNNTGLVANVVNDSSKVVFQIADDNPDDTAEPADSAMVVAEYPTYDANGNYSAHSKTDTLLIAVAALTPSAKIATKPDSIRGIDTTPTPDTDSLSFAWTAKTNAATEQRILLEAEYVIGNDTSTAWFVVSDWDDDHADNTPFDDDFRAWNAALVAATATVQMAVADGSSTLTVQGAALRKALRLAVEVRQAVATGEDANDWVRSAVVTIPKKE